MASNPRKASNPAFEATCAKSRAGASTPRSAARMTLSGIGIVFIAGVIAHNTEEALLLPGWSANGVRWHPRVAPKQFAFAVAVLTVVLLACAVAAVLGGPGSLGAYLFIGYVFAMAANAFVPHIIASIATRSYMPGTATGALFNLPVGILLLLHAIEQGFVQSTKLVWFAPMVALLLAASNRTIIWLGGVLFGGPAASTPSRT